MTIWFTRNCKTGRKTSEEFLIFCCGALANWMVWDWTWMCRQDRQWQWDIWILEVHLPGFSWLWRTLQREMGILLPSLTGVAYNDHRIDQHYIHEDQHFALNDSDGNYCLYGQHSADKEDGGNYWWGWNSSGQFLRLTSHVAWWSCGQKYSPPPGDVDDIDYGGGDGGDVGWYMEGLSAKQC